MEIIEYVIREGKYTTLNYITKTKYRHSPLSYALYNNNFRVAKLLIDYGADVFYKVSIDNKNFKFLLGNGYRISENFIVDLIERKMNVALKYCLNYFTLKNEFILDILSNYYKNRTPLYTFQLKGMVDKNNKLHFSDQWYKVALLCGNYEAFNILYSKDPRIVEVKDEVINEIVNALDLNLKTELIFSIKNRKLVIPLHHRQLLIDLGKCLSREEEQNIMELVLKNNKLELKKYIKQNKINNDFIFEGDVYYYIPIAIEKNVSLYMIRFLLQHGDRQRFYDNVSINNMVYYNLILKNKFDIVEYLMDESDVQDDNLLNYFYVNNHLTNKLLIFLLNKNVSVTSNFIVCLIKDNQNQLLKQLFHNYYFNQKVILTLLTNFYRNKNVLSDQQLCHLIEKETLEKINIDRSMYYTALEVENFEALNIIYKHDYRKHDIIVKDIFYFFNHHFLKMDEQSSLSRKKDIFLNNIKNRDIDIFMDEFYLRNFEKSDERKQMMMKYICENDVEGISKYIHDNKINLSYFNDEKYFDFLIYAIENEATIKMIECIASYYPSLNYIYNNSKVDYQSPLSYALENKGFRIAKQLLKMGADINFKINGVDVATKLYREGCILNNKNIFLFLYDHGYQITSDFIGEFIIENHNSLLKKILSYYIFNEEFCVNMISLYYKNRQPLSDQQLKSIILNKKKREIPLCYQLYAIAVSFNNIEILEMFLELDKDNFAFSFNIDQFCELISGALDNNNFDFIEVLFNSKTTFSFDLSLFMEKFFSSMYLTNKNHIDKKLDIIQFLLDKVMNNKHLELEKINFNTVLINLATLGNINLIEIFIHHWFSHSNFCLEKLDIKLILNCIHHSTEFSNKFRYRVSKYFIEKVFFYPKFKINDNNLDYLLNEITEHHYVNPKFMSLILQHIYSMEEFNFYIISFEKLLHFASQFVITELFSARYNDIVRYFSQFDFEIHDFYDESYNLIKLVIEQSLDHKTFKVQKMNIKKVLFVLTQLDESISMDLINLFFKKLIDHDQFNMQYVSMSEIINGLSILEDVGFVKSIIKDLLNSRSFIFGRFINMKKCIEDSGKIKCINYFKFYIDCVFKHKSFIFNSVYCESILLATCTIHKDNYIDVIMNQIINFKNSNSKLVHLKTIDYDKVFLSANRHNNTLIVKEIHNKILPVILENQKKGHIKKINYEKLLLSASKIDNVKLMTYIVEKLLNVTFTKITGNEKLNKNKPRIKLGIGYMKDNMDSQYLSLIINVLIKLNQIDYVKFIGVTKKLKSIVKINYKDRNGDLPILTVLSSSFCNTDGKREIKEERNLKLLEFFLQNEKESLIPNNLLLLLPIINKKYRVINKLLKAKNISLTFSNEEINNTSSLIQAICRNNVDQVESKIKANKNRQFMSNKQEYSIINEYFNGFTLLILSYLLNYPLIYNYLINHCDVNELDKYGYSILHYAVLKEDIKMVKLLLKYDADIYGKKSQIRNVDGPMDISLTIKNQEIYLLLIKNRKSQNHLENNTRFIHGIPSMYLSFLKRKDFTFEEKKQWLKSVVEQQSNSNQNNVEVKEALSYIINNKCDASYMKIFAEHNIDIFTEDLIIEMVQKDRVDLLQLLIPNYINISYADNESNIIFNEAVRCDSKKVIEYIINSDMKSDNIFINKLLIEKLIQSNRLELLKILRPFYFNENMSKDEIRFFLRSAINNDSTEVLQFLFDNGVSVEEIDDNVIKKAIEDNHLEILKLLIQIRYDEKLMNITNSDELFTFAIKNGNVAIVKYLIDCGIDTTSINNENILQVIIFKNGYDILKLLYSYNLFCLHSPKSGMLLYTAIKNALHLYNTNEIECLQFLVENGIDTNIQYNNKPVLFSVLFQNYDYDYCHYYIIKYLVDHGANVDIVDGEKTFIGSFIENGSMEMIKYLIEHSSDINFKNNKYYSYLMTAVICNRIDAVQYLVEAGIDIHSENKNGDTALKIAIQLGNLDIMNYLMEKGAKFNYNDRKPTVTELIYDILNGNKGKVEYLMKQKLPNQNYYGKYPYNVNPLNVAIKTRNEDIIKILLDC